MTTEFAICVLAREFPFDSSSRGVALLLPASDFRLQQPRGSDSLSGALPIHDPDFDLGHVQPTGVFGGVMELNALQQQCCRLLAQHMHEDLPERCARLTSLAGCTPFLRNPSSTTRSAVDKCNSVCFILILFMFRY